MSVRHISLADGTENHDYYINKRPQQQQQRQGLPPWSISSLQESFFSFCCRFHFSYILQSKIYLAKWWRVNLAARFLYTGSMVTKKEEEFKFPPHQSISHRDKNRIAQNRALRIKVIILILIETYSVTKQPGNTNRDHRITSSFSLLVWVKMP